MKKINIAVLMGGNSPEHEISLISGREVVKNLDPEKYNVLPIVISRDGNRWSLFSLKKLLSTTLQIKPSQREIISYEDKSVDLKSLKNKGIDVFFIAMHGPHGEDGTIQGMLELTGSKYTGSGVLASALGMDKITFRALMKSQNIPIPSYVVFEKGDYRKKIYDKLGDPPFFVKPPDQGSSVGASIVKRPEDLSVALKKAFKFNKKIIVDKYIKGRELTCAILGNDSPIALPVVEIVPLKGEFFDYESKYSESGSEEIVPARINKNYTQKVQSLAIKVYKAVGCKGFARVDFILTKGGNPVVLEINTIPGLTPMSLFPKSAKEAGISYSKLLDLIVQYAKN